MPDHPPPDTNPVTGNLITWLTGGKEGKCDEKMQRGGAHSPLSWSTVCQHRRVPSTIDSDYYRKPERCCQAAHRTLGTATLTAQRPGKRVYGFALFQALDLPMPKHSSYLPGRGARRGQFLPTPPPMKPTDGVRAQSAPSASHQTEIQGTGGSVVCTVQKTWNTGAWRTFEGASQL